MLAIAQLINEAWAYESNNDHEVALRLYKTAFNSVLDINSQIKSSSTTTLPYVSPFEIRSVADYLNHRTCHIQFHLKHARDAITHFKRYIEIFRQHTNSPEYSFEHAAWLSQQYLMFADQFHQAVAEGTKASKTQHPGHYYYEVAMQMIERRKNITEYTNDEIRSNHMPVTNELLAMITTDNFTTFLRQCGWTCIDPEAGPPVAPIHRAETRAKPEPIDYSDIIVKSLYKAIEHFEIWNRVRMHNYLRVIIADEQKAASIYKRCLPFYEKESWTPLVDYIKGKLESLKE